MMNHSSSLKKKKRLQFLIAVLSACLVFAVMQGIHDNYGVMLNGVVVHTGIDYTSVSFVIAVGQILYGVTQPVFGMLALKKSNAFVMLCGVLLMAAGLIATPLCNSLWSLLLFFGIILPTGTGALCFGIVMGAISPIIGEEKAAVVSGIVQASAGIGDALMSPAIQILTDRYGVPFSLPVFSIPILLTIPAVIWLGASKRKQNILHNVQAEPKVQKEKLSKILGDAIHNPAYWCLLIGFSTCGFHMSIIETHLFSQFVSCGIPGNVASFTLTIYGITTMIGAVISGVLGQKFKMKYVLASIYGFRVVIGLSFLLFAKTIPFAFIATGLLGFTGDSTVPPTTGIISQKVGVAKMAIVYGSIFIGHQIGAFASAWLGGVLIHTSQGYSALWIVDLCLALVASIATLQIKDKE